MAGIGFELKKLFQRKGIAALLRAYGYTGIVTTGPMILGILLLLGIMFLAEYFGLPGQSRELLVCMVTYALLASLTLTSFTSMVVTRFIADMLYEEREDMVLASFQGICAILLLIGGVAYGLFLSVAGIPFSYQILDLVLFGELVVVWMAMNYLTAIKDYKGILVSFAMAVLTAFLSGWLFCLVWGSSMEALLAGVCCGYGVMMVSDIALLYCHFPQKRRGQFYFLRWFDEYRSLAFIGGFTNIGLFAHLVIIWFGPIGEQVQGAFYGAPEHDVAALLAFLTILITTINFVASVEVNFYPRYRKFYDLFNGKGSLREIRQAEDEMLTVLESELAYTARKQLYMTVLMLSVGLIFLERLPLGFNDLMEGYFRILCVGYGIYAVGNTVMLMLLYFTDYRGALMATAGFMVGGVAGTCILLGGSTVYYGFGFTLGSGVFCLIALIRLNWFTQNLPYHILSTQPIVAEVRYGVFSKLADRLERRKGHRYET